MYTHTPIQRLVISFESPGKCIVRPPQIVSLAAPSIGRFVQSAMTCCWRFCCVLDWTICSFIFFFFFVGLVAVGREWTFPTHWRNNKHGARTQGWMIFCVFQPLSLYSAAASSFPLGGEALKATGRNYIGIYYCRPKNSSGRFQFGLRWYEYVTWITLSWPIAGTITVKGIYLFLLAWLKIANENNSVKDMWLLDINKQWNFVNNNKNILSCFFN